MAHREDVTRVLAACEHCESVYAARRWPDGDVRVIGQEDCGCGESDFVVVDETDVSAGSSIG